MAIGTSANFVIRDELFNAIFEEQINQNALNASAQSAGAIQIVTAAMEGDYGKRRFFDRLTGGITRRVVTDVNAATDIALTMDEVISVKSNFIYGPYATTFDSFAKMNMDISQMTENLAVQYADELAKTTLNRGLLAAQAAVANVAALFYDYTGTGNMAHAALITGRSKLGDAFGRIKCIVAHSKPWHDLVAANLTVASGNVADFTIYQGSVGTLGLPAFVTDSTSLRYAGTPVDYGTLLLVENAIVITLSESQRMVGDTVTGLGNLVYRVQGEGAYNIELKGFKWDTGNGGANPTDGAIGTGSNWDTVVASHKDQAGVLIRTT